jgi:SAM-dependent methyltransferase
MNIFDYSLHYRRWHNETEEHAAQMAILLVQQIKPHLHLPTSARILDVGCGFGFALGALRQLGYQNTVGLELSSEQAAVCRAAGHNVEVTQDSVEWLNKHLAEFDFIILFDVLEHLPVGIQIDFLRAIHGALRSGGQLLLTVPNANAILSARWRYIDYTHYSSFTEHSLNFVLRNAGFENIWMDATKGIGRFPRRIWRRSSWPAIRKWVVRWCWLQVFKAEQSYENIDEISFELNITAVATKHV